MWWTWACVIEAEMPATYLVEVREDKVPQGTPLWVTANRARNALRNYSATRGFALGFGPDAIAGQVERPEADKSASG